MARRKCDSCGAEFSKGSQFCGSCGATLLEAEPRKRVNKKFLGVFVGAIFGLVALLVAYLVFFPAPLGPKDVRIGLNIPVPTDLWTGSNVDVSSKVTFYSKRDAKYKVVIETKNATMTDWAEFTSATGEYPAVEVTKSAEILPGANSFRVLLYEVGNTKPIATSKEQILQAKQASLPSSCPVDEINLRWATPSDPMEVFPNDSSTHKDCSMGYPNSDVFGPMAYYDVMSDQAFASLKKKEHGQKFKANVNETASYRQYVKDDFSGNYWIYVVNFHGIVLHTDSKADISTFINAIAVK